MSSYSGTIRVLDQERREEDLSVAARVQRLLDANTAPSNSHIASLADRQAVATATALLLERLRPYPMSGLSQLLYNYKVEHGFRARRELLQRVGGVSKESEIPPEKRTAVIEACKGRAAPYANAGPKPDFNSPDFINGIYSRWNSRGAS